MFLDRGGIRLERVERGEFGCESKSTKYFIQDKYFIGAHLDKWSVHVVGSGTLQRNSFLRGFSVTQLNASFIYCLVEFVVRVEKRLEASIDHLNLITSIRILGKTPVFTQVHVNTLRSDENESSDVFWKLVKCVHEDLEVLVTAPTAELCSFGSVVGGMW